MREGEKNGRAVLTWDHLQLLRRLYRLYRPKKWNRNNVRSPFSTAALADEYEMSQSAMHNALTGRTWKKRGKNKPSQTTILNQSAPSL